MDARSLRQVRGFWPDLADTLEDAIPGGCHLLRLLDHWQDNGRHADTRRRAIDLLPDDRGPPLEELFEDASIRAQGDGWRVAERDEETGLEVLERGEETLELARASLAIEGAAADVLRVAVEQQWPSDVEPPVDCSQIFADACAKVLRIHEFPIEQVKDVRLDLGDLTRTQAMRERVVFPAAGDLVAPRLRAAGYARDETGRLWVSRSTSEVYDLVATVTLDPARVALELLWDRRSSSSPPA